MGKSQLIEKLIREADRILEHYQKSYSGLTWREKVLILVELNGTVKKLGINTNESTFGNARERIRLYLLEHVGIIIDAAEVEVVAGISEYGRRIRELRVEDGYKILTCHSNDPQYGLDLKNNQYLLLDPKPDSTAARRWRIANRIRKEVSGSKDRLLKYFMANVGQTVTSEELRYVAKSSEFGRRIRELRTEEGFAIRTKFTGRPDLNMGEYILEQIERIAEPHERKVTLETEKTVYKRDNNTCRICGWNHSKFKKEEPRYLELHHIKKHVDGGENTVENLVVLCNKCHDDVHANRREI